MEQSSSGADPAPVRNLVDESMAALGWDEQREAAFRPFRERGLTSGRVVRVDGTSALVNAGGLTVQARFGGAIATPVAGDWVALSGDGVGSDSPSLESSPIEVQGPRGTLTPNPHRGGDGSRPPHSFDNLRTTSGPLPRKGELTIEVVLERRTALSRARPLRDRERSASQCLAANVDIVFVVQASNNLNVRRLERECAWARACAVAPVVVLTKVDLCGDIDRAIAEAVAAAPGCPVMPVNGLLGDGTAALGDLVPAGRSAALIGASGVGKSTIANRLMGSEVMSTGLVRDNDQRGRHTTTTRHLHVLPNGGVLIDTPGLRSVGLLSDEGIAAAFSDIIALAPGCRFRDCTHAVEPGCAVLSAVREEAIDESRVGSYHKLRREAGYMESKDDPAARKEKTRVFKARNKALRLRERLEK